MNKTTIMYEMPEDQYNRLVEFIQNIDAELGFAVNLTKEQRQKLYPLGDKSLAFIDKTMSYSESRPDLLPASTDMIDFNRDFHLTSQLRNLVNKIQVVTQKLKDSYSVVGASTFMAARKYYGLVKAAAVAGVPGASKISEDLAKRYAHSKPPEKTETPPLTNQ